MADDSLKQTTYTMIYECINCKNKLWKEIPFGESAPIIDDEEACSYCGCRYFSRPRRPKASDYIE